MKQTQEKNKLHMHDFFKKKSLGTPEEEAKNAAERIWQYVEEQEALRKKTVHK